MLGSLTEHVLLPSGYFKCTKCNVIKKDKKHSVEELELREKKEQEYREWINKYWDEYNKITELGKYEVTVQRTELKVKFLKEWPREIVDRCLREGLIV